MEYLVTVVDITAKQFSGKRGECPAQRIELGSDPTFALVFDHFFLLRFFIFHVDVFQIFDMDALFK